MIGKIFLILGPSGVGKGTVEQMIKVRHPEFIFPLSVTTRTIRPNEKNGAIYYFVSEEEFDTYIRENKLLEWAVVHGKGRYGTVKESIIPLLKAGKILVREIDVQGWQNLMKTEIVPQLVSIFIMPPSIECIKQRILHRAPISEEELQARLKSATIEIEKGKICDYHIFSDENEQEKLYDHVMRIIQTEMQR